MQYIKTNMIRIFFLMFANLCFFQKRLNAESFLTVADIKKKILIRDKAHFIFTFDKWVLLPTILL